MTKEERREPMHPLWRVVLRQMREQEDYGYGAVWPAEFFERGFNSALGTNAFSFQMMPLREKMEKEDGYYLKQESRLDGKTKRIFYYILRPERVEDQSRSREEAMRNKARMAVSLRASTLGNPKAVLTDEQRRELERGLEVAGKRLVLMRRQKAILRLIESVKPRLLE